MAIRGCRVTFHDRQGVDHSITIHAETTLEAAAIALRRITEQGFVESEYADSITVELTTTTTQKVSLKRTLERINNPGARSPREASLKARARTA